jgi:hypothetical protein
MKIERKRSGSISRLVIILIIIASLAVAATMIYRNLYENKFFAEKKFEELSRNYYENSLYESFLLEHDGEDLGEAFSKYKTGFKVKLRQILNYEFLEHDMNYRSYFDTDTYSCDTNESYARFTAHEPYGKKDYDVEFKLICND